MNKSDILKNEIIQKTREYFKEKFGIKEEFTEGKTKLNYSGRFFDENELVNLVDSSLEFWLTYGKYSKEFESKLSEFLGVKYSFLVNSGSSANLLAFMALTSPLLGHRQIKRGDEVITVAAGFPTTISPIVQYGAVPVFVDVEIPGYNINVELLENALSPETKAVMLAHTLGNPFNIKKVKEFCQKNNLWLIEDNCDALGSEYFIDGVKGYTGTFGDIGTSSFYPPHHITMGEGGAVYTNDKLLKKIMLSMRDWGRDCYCESGVDNTCGRRFSGKFGSLPQGYDHKYVYSHMGYNLKATDMQAAIGVAQLDKIVSFSEKRRENHEFFYNNLKKFEKFLILPEKEENSKPSWFGFLLTVKDNAGFTRNQLSSYLEDNLIQTRNLFSGNIVKHPCFESLEQGVDYRISGELVNTDRIMNNTFWFGVYPGITPEKRNYIIKVFEKFLSGY